MNGRVRVLLEKEWAELIRHRTLVGMTLLLPIVFLLIPFAMAILLPELDPNQSYADPDLQKAMTAMTRHDPALRALGPKVLFQVLIFRQFLSFLLFIPVMGAMSIATYSIVGEKVSRSLEPLLATPISTGELLAGKCLAAAIPATAITWLFFALYLLGIGSLASPGVLRHVLNATGLIIIFLIAPLIGLLGITLGVITSSRSTDPRSAQQVGVVVILPLVGIFVGQMFGLFLLTPVIVLLGAALLGVIDLITLKIGAALFQRETILTRWK